MKFQIKNRFDLSVIFEQEIIVEKMNKLEKSNPS